MTMSVTSLVVGFIAFLKKLTTTALNLSLSAGNLRNACYTNCLKQFLRHCELTYDFVEELSEDTDQLVIYELAALESRLLETLDLLLDDDFEGSGANEKRWRGALHRDLSSNEADRPRRTLTEELYRIVRISPSFTWSKGSIVFTP